MTPSSARHKRGCKCKSSKCLKKYCECYRAKVGCSDGCRCEDCDNSFRKKSESIFERVEKWKNLSHEKLNTVKAMSDSIKGGTANQFTPTWEELFDISHLTPLSDPHSSAVPSLTSANMGNCPNVSQAQLQEGSGLQLLSSYLHCSPDILIENSNPTNTVESGSPNQKRVSPPKLQSYRLGSNSTPGLRSGRKLVIRAAPPFPLLTPYCYSEDRLNQTENDHQGSSHGQ
ncbi:hypothetical protein REPUB_Repub14bG0035400 [Reevesia pubescens]